MPGAPDAQGVYMFAEDDVFTTESEKLNTLAESVSDALALDRSRIDDLEDDTGWITVTAFTNGWAVSSGNTVMYRRLRGVVYLRGRIAGGSAGPAFTLPTGFRPSFNRLHSGVNAGSATVRAWISITTAGIVQGSVGQTPQLDEVVFPAEA